MRNPHTLFNNNERLKKLENSDILYNNVKLGWTTKETGGNDRTVDLQCLMLRGVIVQDETWWFYTISDNSYVLFHNNGLLFHINSILT